MARRVLMFGGSQQTMRRALALGIEPLLLQPPEEYDEKYLPLVGDLAAVDYGDEAGVLALARDLYNSRPFLRAVSVTEAGMLPAARVNQALGLGGNPVSAVERLKDKASMRRLLNGIGLSPVAAAETRDAAGIARFGAEYGYPVIVKPPDASASVGVSKVDGPAGVEAAWRRATGSGGHRVLVEEYLTGPEISVEAFSYGPGRHHVVAFTAKTTLPNFVEIGHVVPAELSAGDARLVAGLVTALLNAVGHRDGPSHTEVKLTAAGPRIIESHNRQGGDRITDLVELVHGVDLIALMLAWATGQAAEWAAPPPARGAAAIRFLTPPPGLLTTITGADEVRTWEGVVDVQLALTPGDPIPTVQSSRDRAGHVLTVAETIAAATTLASAATNHIHFHTMVWAGRTGPGGQPLEGDQQSGDHKERTR